MTGTTLADILATVDQDEANTLFTAFQHAAAEMNIATVWWGFAMIQANLLVTAPEEIRLRVAGDLAKLCELALPAAMMAQREPTDTGE